MHSWVIASLLDGCNSLLPGVRSQLCTSCKLSRTLPLVSSQEPEDQSI